MNYRKRRANAWAGLYVGLVGDAARSESVSGEQDDSSRTEGES